MNITIKAILLILECQSQIQIYSFLYTTWSYLFKKDTVHSKDKFSKTQFKKRWIIIDQTHFQSDKKKFKCFEEDFKTLLTLFLYEKYPLKWTDPNYSYNYIKYMDITLEPFL